MNAAQSSKTQRFLLATAVSVWIAATAVGGDDAQQIAPNPYGEYAQLYAAMAASTGMVTPGSIFMR